jgi:hypothetical protein
MPLKLFSGMEKSFYGRISTQLFWTPDMLLQEPEA